MDEYGWKPPRQNPSSMSSSSSDQSIEGMPMPTEGTLCPSQPGINTNLTAPYPTQSTPYPNHQTAEFPGYPGQEMPQPLPQQANPPLTNPIDEQQPTAPPACPSTTSEYNHNQLPNNHASTSSDQTAPFGTNPQIVRKLTPTILHNVNLNAFNDAEVLHEEMQSIKRNKKKIISILSKCNNQHRQDTASTFNILYNKDLMKELESKILNFNAWKLKDLIAAMMTPIVDYYAEEVHNCISETHADKDVLIMILCTLKNQDIHRVRVRYGKKYGKSMETDISGDRPGRFERLMVSLCRGERDESALTDIDAAEIDARRLYNVGHLGTHEPEFNFIFTRRNVHQLRLIFKKYSRLYGHDISQEIDREFSGHMKTALLTIVKVAKNSAFYFAEQLNDALSGIGTRDQKLIFICVTRSEIDMGDIRRAFCKQYRKKLKKHISENTSGDYQNCLIKLINSNSTILETIYAWPYSIFQSILYFFVLINLLDRLFIFIQYRTPNENIASFLYTRNEKTWI